MSIAIRKQRETEQNACEKHLRTLKRFIFCYFFAEFLKRLKNRNKLNHSFIDAHEMLSLSTWFTFIRKFTIEKATIRVTSGLHGLISTAMLKS